MAGCFWTQSSATPWSAGSTDSNATVQSRQGYDKLAVGCEATVTVAAINEWL